LHRSINDELMRYYLNPASSLKLITPSHVYHLLQQDRLLLAQRYMTNPDQLSQRS
jgi:hypothetical protein